MTADVILKDPDPEGYSEIRLRFTGDTILLDQSNSVVFLSKEQIDQLLVEIIKHRTLNLPVKHIVVGSRSEIESLEGHGQT